MTENADVQGLQSKAEARLARLKAENLVTRIAVPQPVRRLADRTTMHRAISV
jgi:hypothetical protein